MKKLIAILITLAVLSVLFTSCDIFLPDATTEPECVMHIWSEYKYNELGHWREYTCGCPWPETFEEHINHDADMLCDVCGATVECQHIDEDKNEVCDNCGIEFIILVWHYTDTWHWMVYESPVGEGVPDVVFSEGEHIDEDQDGVCDMCNYQIKKD